MDFTGERFVPSVEGKIRYEHLHRYALALEFVAGGSVLDLASGEGYGAAILASTAESVTGVDVDFQTIQSARHCYAVSRVRFVVGDCSAVPLQDAAFDVITSFETIEHHDKHEEMLGEIKRLLKPAGVLVISSPNRGTYSDESGQKNPYHVKELDYDELHVLLGRHFKHIRFYGQRLAAGSFVFPLTDSGNSAMEAWTGHSGKVSRQVCSQRSPIYFVAVCSDDSRIEQQDVSSVYLERATDLLERLTDDKKNQIEQMQAHVQNTEKEMVRQRIIHESQFARHTNELRDIRRGYEAQIGREQPALIQEQATSRELRRSVLDVREQLLQSQRSLAQAQATVIQQSDTISRQADVLTRQSDILNWIYASRAWRLASAFRNLKELRQGWQTFERRLRRALSLPGQDRFLGAVDCARFPDLFGDVFEIQGWVYSFTSQVVLVEAFLGDWYLGRLRYGVPRPDVASASEAAPLKCGYSQRVQIGGMRNVGLVVLKIRAYDDLGHMQIYTSSIPVEPPAETIPVEPSVPGVEETANSSRPTATEVRGPLLPVASPGQLSDVIAEFQDRMERDPSILDWTSTLDLVRTYPRLAICSPLPGSREVLPYLDRSIDLVVVSTGDPDRTAEARRIAGAALVQVDCQAGPSGITVGKVEVDWHDDEAGSVSLSTASIVIPVYNQIHYTENCLTQLGKTLPKDFRGEIVVVDDASSDTTPSVLERWSRIDGRITVLRNSRNSGFVVSCNRGAEAASGKILVFLNNDTLPRPGWLQPLLRVLRDNRDAGAVCGKLIYPDGRLQEAGGLVFSDGSACNFGKNERAEAPMFNFLREVDYGSGALLATPRALFMELGGFDTRFAPGYYEDADYCFSLRAHGYRVYYQPESVVVHAEGVSAGTETDSGMKRYQDVNRTKFVEKWREALARQPLAPSHYDFVTLHQLSVGDHPIIGHGK